MSSVYQLFRRILFPGYSYLAKIFAPNYKLISDLFSTRVDTIMPGAGIVAEWIMEETGKLIVGTVELIGWGRNYYEDLEEV